MKNAVTEGALSVIGAETGHLEGGLRISRERPGYTGEGYVTGFRQREGDRWSVRAGIPETGHYTLSVRCAADSRRICNLLVNGNDVGMCEVKGDGGVFSARKLGLVRSGPNSDQPGGTAAGHLLPGKSRYPREPLCG